MGSVRTQFIRANPKTVFSFFFPCIDKIIRSVRISVSPNMCPGDSDHNSAPYEPAAGASRMRVHKKDQNLYVLSDRE